MGLEDAIEVPGAGLGLSPEDADEEGVPPWRRGMKRLQLNTRPSAGGHQGTHRERTALR